MRILAIGDIVGDSGCNFLREKLGIVKEEYKIDFVIANGDVLGMSNEVGRLMALLFMSVALFFL